MLLPAVRLVNDLTQTLRLTLDVAFDPATAPEGVKRLMMRVTDAPSFARLEDDLRQRLAEVAALFDQLVV